MQPTEIKGRTQIVEPAWPQDERAKVDTLRAAKGIGAAVLVWLLFWALLLAWWLS